MAKYSYFIEGRPVSHLRKKNFCKKYKKIFPVISKERLNKTRDIKIKLIFWLKVSGRNQDIDLDNMIKVILDLLTGVFYVDDNQVKEIYARKELNDCLEGVTIDIEI